MEAAVFQAMVDLLDPVHVGAPRQGRRIGPVVEVDPIAPGFLCRIAGGIGGAQHGLDALAGVIDRHQADADTHPKAAVLPAQAQVVDCLEHGIGHAPGLLHLAALKENAEFVPPEAGQRIPLAHHALQDAPDLAQELVAGDVAAAVVDRLELIEIEVAKRIVDALRPRDQQRVSEAFLERSSVGQPGQRIVVRVVDQLLGPAPGLGDVLRDYQHARLVLPPYDRPGGLPRPEFAAVLADLARLPAMNIARLGQAALELTARISTIIRQIEVRDRLSDELAHGIAELRCAELIGREHHALAVHGDEHRRVQVVQRLVALLAVLQRLPLHLELLNTLP